MTMMNNLLTFQIDQQHYALPLDPIQQIVSMVSITPIPQASSIAEGIINVHGQAVPVVDFRSYLGKPKHQYQFHTPIILLRIKDHQVGLIVDQINDVISLPAIDRIDPMDILPEELHSATLVVSVAFLSGTSVMILDADQLFQPGQVDALVKACEYLDSIKVMQ